MHTMCANHNWLKQIPCKEEEFNIGIGDYPVWATLYMLHYLDLSKAEQSLAQ